MESQSVSSARGPHGGMPIQQHGASPELRQLSQRIQTTIESTLDSAIPSADLGKHTIHVVTSSSGRDVATTSAAQKVFSSEDHSS